MKTFWTLWVFNALMALIPIWFFFVGIGDGTVGSENIGIWVILLVVVLGILGGSFQLMRTNHLKAARIILIISAIPCLLAILFFLVVMLSNPRWN